MFPTRSKLCSLFLIETNTNARHYIPFFIITLINGYYTVPYRTLIVSVSLQRFLSPPSPLSPPPLPLLFSPPRPAPWPPAAGVQDSTARRGPARRAGPPGAGEARRRPTAGARGLPARRGPGGGGRGRLRLVVHQGSSGRRAPLLRRAAASSSRRRLKAGASSWSSRRVGATRRLPAASTRADGDPEGTSSSRTCSAIGVLDR